MKEKIEIEWPPIIEACCDTIETKKAEDHASWARKWRVDGESKEDFGHIFTDDPATQEYIRKDVVESMAMEIYDLREQVNAMKMIVSECRQGICGALYVPTADLGKFHIIPDEHYRDHQECLQTSLACTHEMTGAIRSILTGDGDLPEHGGLS